MTKADTSVKKRWDTAERKTTGSCFSSLFFSSSRLNVWYWHECIEQYHQSNKMKGCFNIKSLSALGCVSVFVSVPVPVRGRI